jgi:hypothetical protein
MENIYNKLNTWAHKKLPLILKIFIGLLALIFITEMFSDEQVKNKVLTEHAKDSIKEEKQVTQIVKQFSTWDGSHIKLTKYIKENMNDPDSFEHIDTKYFIQKNSIVIIERFRGKNVYGGLVANMIEAKVDMDGNIIEIVEQN